ncbi:MAG: RDD family protein [Pseudomonadota bacterium]|nr:RDD family protein [Pseudomonadota bacterium]
MAFKKSKNIRSSGLIRRLAAGLYDWMLIIALMIVVSLIFVIKTGDVIDPKNWLYRSILLSIIVLFFVGFWSYRGQTPGMLAWRLQISNISGDAVSIQSSIKRLLAATLGVIALGIGHWWQLFDRDELSLLDRYSDTRINYSPQKNK